MIYIAVGLIFIAALWGLYRAGNRGSRSTESEVVLRPTKDWEPPEPAGTPAHLSITKTVPLEVAGESYRMLEFRRLFQDVDGFHTYQGAEFDALALLVADPDNPHGEGHAVSVWVDGEHVGWVPHDQSQDWFYVADGMAKLGECLAMTCRVWASLDMAREKFSARVTLDAPDLSEWKDDGVG